MPYYAWEFCNEKLVCWENRLKDIKQSVEVMRERYNVGVNFRHVHTSENPADLISRGVSQKKFTTQFKFWLSVPLWLAGDHISWLVNELNC